MRRIIACALLLAAASCLGPSEAYVRADRATHTAIAPEYVRYVEADASLDDAAKARRKRTVDLWDLRIRKAEEAQR